MSEPTLYRMDREKLDYENWMPSGDAKQVIEEAIEIGVLVPVERCEHGNYAEHIIEGSEHPGVFADTLYDWCPGAGIGGSE